MLLGQKVYTKKTGLPAAGYVVGTMVPQYWATLHPYNMGTYQSDSTTWDKLYPDWRRNPLVYVHFKEPQKTISWEEWSANAPEEWTEYEIKEKYDELPTQPAAVYPIEDLEFVGDITEDMEEENES
jgi:hypothetical protein